jgi:hypothetical protein
MNGFPEPTRARSHTDLVRRAVDSDVEVGSHRILATRRWWDEYPATVDISVQVDVETGLAFTVISSQAAWLRNLQLDEVIDWLSHCQHIVSAHNAATVIDGPDGRLGRDEDHQSLRGLPHGQ